MIQRIISDIAAKSRLPVVLNPSSDLDTYLRNDNVDLKQMLCIGLYT